MELKVDNVDFSYVENEKLLSGVSGIFKKGQVTALVGKSGSGKSTLIKILLGLYDADAGKVTYQLNVINKTISYVQNKDYIFNIILVDFN